MSGTSREVPPELRGGRCDGRRDPRSARLEWAAISESPGSFLVLAAQVRVPGRSMPAHGPGPPTEEPELKRLRRTTPELQGRM